MMQYRPQTRRRETVECEPHRRLKLWIYDLHTNKHFTLKEPSSSEIDWRSVSPKGQRCSADQNPLKRVRYPPNMPGFPRHAQSLGAFRRKARRGER
jgi:hypothetical protein